MFNIKNKLIKFTLVLKIALIKILEIVLKIRIIKIMKINKLKIIFK